MFIVLLRFSDNKAQAASWLAAHRAWLERGFDDGVFLLAGSLETNQGGAMLAHQTTREQLAERLAADPFVQAGIVTTEVMSINPGKTADTLSFLLA
ncbi:YciI family protein [Vogesella mureinivorans]|uniref:YciI family protein n=1 Tax=Vogesella mureinivorans TaxID=657276 RepID=UPI0011CA21DA|nr:YciI family protein [Vogesella mureinivorans]